MATLRLNGIANKLSNDEQLFIQVERDAKVVEEVVVLEHMTHTDLAQVILG